MYAGLNKANEVMERIARPGAQKQYIIYTNKYPGGPFAGGVNIYGSTGKVFVSTEQILRKMYTLDPVVANVVVVPDNKTSLFDAKDSLQAIVGQTDGAVETSGLADIASAFDKTANQFDTSPVVVIGEPVQQGNSLLMNGGESYDPNSYITKYRWDCNDDGVYDIEDSQPTAICEYSKNYSGIIGLEVETADGQKAKMYRQVSIVVGSYNPETTQLNIDVKKLDNNLSEYRLVDNQIQNFVLAVYDDEGNIIDSTNAATITIDASNIATDYVIFKLYKDGQELGSKRLQIKNFPPPKEETKDPPTSQQTPPNNIISEDDYLAMKKLGDISEKSLTLPADSAAQPALVLTAQSPSVSAPASAVTLSAYSAGSNTYPQIIASNTSNDTGTILSDDDKGQTSSVKADAQKSEVLGDSIIKRSNIPGFILFMTGFLVLLGLLLFIIKKANNKLDRA
jgi:hypothetical protein